MDLLGKSSPVTRQLDGGRAPFAVAAWGIATVVVALCFGGTGDGTRPAAAQQIVDIVAVVNDEPITAYDVQQRLNLIIRSSSLEDVPEVRKELAPRVVDSLVEENLQLQEAKRLNIKVGKKEVDSAIALIERQNRISPGGLDAYLAERKIDKRTLVHQVEASLAWTDVVRQKFLRTVTVTEEEIDRAVERIKDNADDPRLLLAEIFIAVDSPRDEATAQQNANRIFEELRKGANFPVVARQFSQSASAERGGDLGWVLPGELEPEVRKVLMKLPGNAVTEPIRTSSGYHILALRDRREPPSNSAESTVVSLRQVVLNIPPSASSGEIQSQRDLADTIRGSVQGCQDFLSVSNELGAKMSGDLGQLKLSELPPELRQVVASLDIGAPSPAIVTDQGIRILMVCDRQTPSLNLPSREEVRQRLIVQRLEVRARRYMRELRDTAFLDIRAS